MEKKDISRPNVPNLVVPVGKEAILRKYKKQQVHKVDTQQCQASRNSESEDDYEGQLHAVRE